MLSLNMDSLGYPFYCVIYSVRVRFSLTNFHVTCYRSDCNLGKINCSHVVFVFPFFSRISREQMSDCYKSTSYNEQHVYELY